MELKAPAGSPPRIARFGPFEADFVLGVLRRGGRRVRLQEQPLRLLALLTGRPGELVTRDELRAQLWPADTFVDFEHGLNAAIKRLRDALGDSAARPRYVETIPRRGYRWLAPLDTAVSAAETHAGSAAARGDAPQHDGPEATIPPVPLAVSADGPTRVRPSPAATAAVMVALAIMVVLAWSLARQPRAASPASTKLLEVELPDGQMLHEVGRPFAVSHDGTKLVYAVGSFQGSQLVIRSLDRLGATTILGTVSGRSPFFSPDDQWVGFGADDDSTVKKVSVMGGPVVTVAPTNGAMTGGAFWDESGIYYSAGGFTGEAVVRVSPDGGTAEPVTTLDAARGESAHVDPQRLPGGRGILFAVRRDGQDQMTDLAVQPREARTHRVLVPGADFGRYVSTGHLVYGIGDRLLAVPFDLATLRLAGSPVPIADGVSRGVHGMVRAALTDEGTLVYVPSERLDQRTLVWVTRGGREEPLPLPRKGYDFPVLSPDGRRLAVSVRAGTDPSRGDLWVHDLGTQSIQRMTSVGTATNAVWSPDGGTLAFALQQGRRISMVTQPADPGARATELFWSDAGLWPGSWTPDRGALAYMVFSRSTTGGDLWVYAGGGGGRRTPYLDSTATEWGARLSPDGRLMAYISNASGRWEAYVRPFPGPGASLQVSTEGGIQVAWSPNGRELFFRNGRGLFAVRIGEGAVLAAGRPRLLFEGRYAAGLPGVASYDVEAGGRRFLMVKPGSEEAGPQRLRFVLNWAGR